jgi:putative transposase
MVAAAIRTIFAQPDAGMVREQLEVIAGMLGRHSVKVETMLRDATEDLLAFTGFPPAHWKKIWSTDEIVNHLLGRVGVLGPISLASAAAA